MVKRRTSRALKSFRPSGPEIIPAAVIPPAKATVRRGTPAHQPKTRLLSRKLYVSMLYPGPLLVRHVPSAASVARALRNWRLPGRVHKSVMNIAVIGSGNVGDTLARKLAVAGHQVVIGGRDPAKADLQQLVADIGAKCALGNHRARRPS